MLGKNLSNGSGSVASTAYVDDVFSAYTYTGTGTSLSITNGIDLSTNGGMVWAKDRTSPNNHLCADTVRGVNNNLLPNSTSANTTVSNQGFTAFSSSGFTVGTNGNINTSGESFVSWTFRKAIKFFDVVTYTGDGSVGRALNHSLGIVPGLILVKSTSAAGSWYTYHRSTGNAQHMVLEATDASTGSVVWNSTSPTSTQFTVSNLGTNGNGTTYIAYLFAHDTDTTNGIIQCGSFTTDAGGIAPDVELGWEPQYVLFKPSSTTGNWNIVDTSRIFSLDSPYNENLSPNLTSAAANYGRLTLKATGFKVGSDVLSATCIYMAIRRSNKPPTVGTQVYNAIARAGTGAAATVTGVGFAPDALVTAGRTYDNGAGKWGWIDRLRGKAPLLISSTTSAEQTSPTVTSFDMTGVSVGTDAGWGFMNISAQNFITYFFKRAPGVFDEVCYTGTGVAKTEAHNLSVVPELMIVKDRAVATAWAVYSNTLGNTGYLNLNSVVGNLGPLASLWNSTTPTASVFSLGTSSLGNNSGDTYVAYLFATKAGISKVFSYTGNGSSQTIDCGFTTGARFILIKRTDSTGDWYVWDTVRGIVAGNDPHLSFNTTAAEVTTDDSIDPDTSGFIVNQLAATNVNVTSATYIGLAFA